MKTLFLVLVLLSAFVTGCSSGANEASAPPSSPTNTNATASVAPKASPPAPNTLPLLPQPPPGLPALKQEAKPEAKPAASANAKPAIASQPVSRAKAPKLILPVSQIDFGNVSQGKSVVRHLVVKNTGKGDLNIDSVAPSCGCTAVDFPKVLRPGNAGVIKVKVETGNVAGPKSKSMTIKSNDPDHPSLVVSIKLLVKS